MLARYAELHAVAELQLCDGASAEERARWFLKPAQEFHYLNQSTCFDIPGDSNAEEYQVRPAWPGHSSSTLVQQRLVVAGQQHRTCMSVTRPLAAAVHLRSSNCGRSSALDTHASRITCALCARAE